MTDLKALAASLGPGESRAGLECPDCGRRGPFSVFATDEGHGWRCHHADCGHSRFFPAIAVHQDSTGFKPVRPVPFLVTTPGPRSPIWDRLGLNVGPDLRGAASSAPGAAADDPGPPGPAEVAGILGFGAKAGFDNVLVWTLRGFDFEVLGHVSRDYDTKRIQTWRGTPDRPLYGYWSLEPSRTMWIVEDPVSAARLGWGGVDAMALLGTHLTAPVLGELRDHCIRWTRRTGTRKMLVVALDPDAVETSAKLAGQLTYLVPADTIWVPLRSDPKDLPWGELKRLIEVTRAGT